MRILGVTSLFHDTGVAVLEKGKITHALNEERLSRKKMHLGFPHRSLEYISSQVKKDFDVVAVSDIPAQELLQKIKFSMFDQSLLHPNPYITLKSQAMMTRWLWKTMKWYRYFQNEQALVFKKLGLPVKRLEHHVNHAASAYFTSGFKKCLVVTIDNHGDGICGSVSLGDKNQLVRLDALPWPHSPGFFYAMITKVLGFKPGRHEGKITGLAAFGNAASPVYDLIKKLMWFENGTIKTHALMGLRGWVYGLARRFSREDLSAAFQRVLEEVVSSYVKFWMEKTGVFDVALAGGVFGNVKLNQRIIEAGAKNLFVHPHMGDGGTGAGAALHYAMVEGEAKPYEIPHAYLGPSYSEAEMKAELIKQGLPVERSDDIEGDVAEVLAKDKVVAFFSGAMEYGPRALGARSVMYSAVDPKVNEWLNKQLNRCYDEETEILTNEGWKFMCNIKDDEVVATLNAEKNALEYQKIQRRISYDFDGDMYHLKNKRVDLLVTPNHNMWVKRKHAKDFQFMQVDDVAKIQTYHYEKKGGVEWEGEEKEFFEIGGRRIPMDLWLEFLGYYISEGSYNYDGYGHYRVSVAQSTHSQHFGVIQECLQQMPYNVFYSIKEFIINNKELYTHLEVFGKCTEKFVPREFMNLSKRQLGILFMALMKGDGNFRGTGFRYGTTSYQLASDVQEIALKLGFSAYLSKQKRAENPNHSQYYMVRIGRSPVTTIKNYQISREYYKGKVYCVTVPNHILFVRRNGKSVFSGNSEFMPFAPVTLERFAKKCYKNFVPGALAARFMTVTFDCTDFMKDNSPATVHVDGTARPQIISKGVHKSYNRVLEQYFKLTKIPTLVNTSFNMHEEPIVCSPFDAIRAFKLGHLDYLALGPFLVKHGSR